MASREGEAIGLRELLFAPPGALWFEPKYHAAEFISGDILSFGGLLRVEVHSAVPGVTWRPVWKRKVAGSLLDVPTWFASVEDLVAMKEAAARPEKGLPDLRRLRLLLERRSRRPSSR